MVSGGGAGSSGGGGGSGAGAAGFGAGAAGLEGGGGGAGALSPGLVRKSSTTMIPPLQGVTPTPTMVNRPLRMFCLCFELPINIW